MGDIETGVVTVEGEQITMGQEIEFPVRTVKHLNSPNDQVTLLWFFHLKLRLWFYEEPKNTENSWLLRDPTVESNRIQAGGNHSCAVIHVLHWLERIIIIIAALRAFIVGAYARPMCRSVVKLPAYTWVGRAIQGDLLPSTAFHTPVNSCIRLAGTPSRELW